MARAHIRPLLVALVTLACDVSQPLAPPQLPLTARLTCIDAGGCPGGQVCHVAVSGGQCGAPCASDDPSDPSNDPCPTMAAGYVCHLSLNGGMCAPPCNMPVGDISGDRICAAIATGATCDKNGRCQPSAVSSAASVRLFNAIGGTSVTLLANGAPLLMQATNGALSDPATVLGLTTFTAQDGQGQLLLAKQPTKDKDGNPIPGVPASAALTLAAGNSHLVVVYELGDGTFGISVVQENFTLPPPAQQAWIQYLIVAPAIGAQELRFTPAGGAPQLVYGSVSFGDLRTGVRLPASAGTLAVGEPPNRPATMSGPVTLVDGHGYTVLTWGSPNEVFDETIVLDGATVIARFHPAALRLANGTADGQGLVLDVDDRIGLLRAEDPLTTSPASGYQVVPPGAHRLVLHYSFAAQSVTALDTMATLVDGHRYTVLGGGNFSPSAGTPVQGLVLDDSAMTVSATQVAVRGVHFSGANKASTMALNRVIGGNAEAAFVTGISFGAASAFSAFDAATPFRVTAAFPDVMPVASIQSAQATIAGGVSFTLVASGAMGNQLWLLDDQGNAHNVTGPTGPTGP